jgi:hypothetical protein
VKVLDSKRPAPALPQLHRFPMDIVVFPRVDRGTGRPRYVRGRELQTWPDFVKGMSIALSSPEEIR